MGMMAATTMNSRKRDRRLSPSLSYPNSISINRNEVGQERGGRNVLVTKEMPCGDTRSDGGEVTPTNRTRSAGPENLMGASEAKCPDRSPNKLRGRARTASNTRFTSSILLCFSLDQNAQ